MSKETWGKDKDWFIDWSSDNKWWRSVYLIENWADFFGPLIPWVLCWLFFVNSSVSKQSKMWTLSLWVLTTHLSPIDNHVLVQFKTWNEEITLFSWMYIKWFCDSFSCFYSHYHCTWPLHSKSHFTYLVLFLVFVNWIRTLPVISPFIHCTSSCWQSWPTCIVTCHWLQMWHFQDSEMRNEN